MDSSGTNVLKLFSHPRTSHLAVAAAAEIVVAAAAEIAVAAAAEIVVAEAVDSLQVCCNWESSIYIYIYIYCFPLFIGF